MIRIPNDSSESVSSHQITQQRGFARANETAQNLPEEVKVGFQENVCS